jgi:hypothetical protein
MEGLRKIMKNLKIAGIPGEIRTEYLNNRSLESYRYASLLDMWKCVGGRSSLGFLSVASV